MSEPRLSHRNPVVWQLVVLVSSITAPAQGQSPDLSTLRKLKGEFQQFMSQAKYADADARARQMVQLADAKFADRPDIVAETLYMQGMVLHQLGRYADAERAIERQLSVVQKLADGKFKQESIAWAANNLAVTQHGLGKFGPAEAHFRQAGDAFEGLEGAESLPVAAVLHNLGNLCRSQGRYLEAEHLLRRGLTIEEAQLGADHVRVAGTRDDLARTLREQKRYDAAEPLIRQSLAVFEKQAPQSPSTALCRNNLATVLRLQGRYDLAEPLHRQSLQAWEAALGKDSQDAAWTWSYLARLELARGRLSEAQQHTQRVRSILEKLWGTDHPDLAIPLQLELELARRSDRPADAEKLADRLIDLTGRFASPPMERAGSYGARAQLRWDRGDQHGAIDDLRQALALADQQQAQVAGSDVDRSEYFLSFDDMFDTMIVWQAELKDLAAVFDAIERRRAFVLRQLLNTTISDPYLDIPVAEAQPLKARQAAADVALSTAKRQLENAVRQRVRTGQPTASELARLSAELRKAQQQVLTVQAEVRLASPSYRKALEQVQQVGSLAELQAHLTDAEATFLEYHLGANQAFVLHVRPEGGPQLEPLIVSAEAGKSLDIEAGPLSERGLKNALLRADRRGVCQLLSTPDDSQFGELTAKLRALAEVLLPADVRRDLADGRSRRLIISPDGVLGLLSFEALMPGVTATEPYLLDVTEAVSYVPSATILTHLVGGVKSVRSADGGVLSVGDPVYASQAGAARVLSQLKLYLGLGGVLNDLGHAHEECTQLSRRFRDQGVATNLLLEAQATEQAARTTMPGRRIVHFACHGFADDRLGNAFGALALTPGPSAANPADDGFLTLSEIAALNLSGCELAILSACQTNAGPDQQGEGVWSLSRGFLTAGSRRVIASNWLLDDRAAAELIAHMGADIAGAWANGPRFAEHLHAAKSHVRQQDAWQHPAYWAALVQVGPY